MWLVICPVYMQNVTASMFILYTLIDETCYSSSQNLLDFQEITGGFAYHTSWEWINEEQFYELVNKANKTKDNYPCRDYWNPWNTLLSIYKCPCGKRNLFIKRQPCNQQDAGLLCIEVQSAAVILIKCFSD